VREITRKDLKAMKIAHFDGNTILEAVAALRAAGGTSPCDDAAELEALLSSDAGEDEEATITRRPQELDVCDNEVREKGKQKE
jgi:hypothetical protein